MLSSNEPRFGAGTTAEMTTRIFPKYTKRRFWKREWASLGCLWLSEISCPAQCRSQFVMLFSDLCTVRDAFLAVRGSKYSEGGSDLRDLSECHIKVLVFSWNFCKRKWCNFTTGKQTCKFVSWIHTFLSRPNPGCSQPQLVLRVYTRPRVSSFISP